MSPTTFAPKKPVQVVGSLHARGSRDMTLEECRAALQRLLPLIAATMAKANDTSHGGV